MEKYLYLFKTRNEIVQSETGSTLNEALDKFTRSEPRIAKWEVMHEFYKMAVIRGLNDEGQGVGVWYGVTWESA